MKSQVGLWIDQRQAFIVELTEDELRTNTIESNVEEHIDQKRGSRSAAPYTSQGIFAEDHADRRYQQQLTLFYQKIAQELDGAESIFIFGPSMAKKELYKYLEETTLRNQPDIKVETADQMPEVQIVEKTKQHFHYKKGELG
ncbi:hypothetical protein [Kangiella shandongensis]|uniref:hypothetical protein n=1 Tax=Kangiella shandongensis TaxID=2763258 RepID=UPI001CBFBB41|nr:hypothetical protein [Kangiella shandongensis]